jgi:C4-dicarboxylate-specific signal transduction histidine kinase
MTNELSNWLLQAHRVVTMGQLTASIAHEVRQPLSATALDAEAALRWLGRNAPKIEEANACLEDLIKHNNRAIEIIERIHRFVKGGGPQMVRLDMNEPIVEVIRLAHGEFVKNGVTVRTELADKPAAHPGRSGPTPTGDAEFSYQRHSGDERCPR